MRNYKQQQQVQLQTTATTTHATAARAAFEATATAKSAATGKNINNGNSNVAIAVADGNVAVAVNGVAEIAVFADTGVYVTGVITANGNITGDTFAANAAVISGNLEAEYANITTSAGMDISGGNLRINEITGLGGELIAQGNVSGLNVNTGNLDLTGNVLSNLWVDGNIAGGNAALSGNLEMTGGYLLLNELTGLGGELVAQGNVSGLNVNTGNLDLTGNVLSNLWVDGNISATNAVFLGQLGVTGANINIVDVTAVGGNLNAVGATVSGNVTANYFLGNGACLTGVITSVANINNGTSNVEIATPDGNVAVTVDGTANVAVFANTGVSISGTVDATGNITGDVILGNAIDITNDAIIGGNLTVNGNVTYVNVEELNVEDPIIGLGRGPNNAPLTTDDGKDRGEQLWYYDSAEKSAFIGYDNSADKLIAAVNVTITNEVVTVGNFGNFQIGVLEAAQANITGNITVGNLSTIGLVSSLSNILANNVIVRSQGNILFYDSDDSNYVGLRANNSVSANIVWTLPSADGNNGQVLSTDGTGNLQWSTGGGGGGGITWTTQANTAPISPNAGDFWYDSNAQIKYQYIDDGTGNDQWVDQSAPTTFQSISTGQIINTSANGTGNIGTAALYFGNIFVASVNAATVLSSGNITGGNLITAGIISATGNITGGNVSGTGLVGTLLTAAQTNITSVGTLGSLTVTGNVTGGNMITAGLVSLSSIAKTGSNGVGNIGQSDNTFNTIFAKATSAQYADLAEIYQPDQDYVPGTVVIFGGTKEITQSAKSHDDRIAGIVSTNPAFMMNSGAKGIAVALTGRVPCRVLGPVSKGNMLVSSDVPGVAQRMQHWRPGSVIGKSLVDSHDDSVRIIEIVVGRF